MYTLTPRTEVASRPRARGPTGHRGRRAHLRSRPRPLGRRCRRRRCSAASTATWSLVRRIDAEAVALQRQGQLGLWAPLPGQEAVQIGTARALRRDDFVFPSYRENRRRLRAGVRSRPTSSRAWRGEPHSGYDPYDINIATPQIIIGAQTLHATGYAMGIQRRRRRPVAVAYFGDGATSEGDVNEAMVFAATLPARRSVFVCQNNHWAISEPVRLQSTSRSPDRAPGFGIPSMRVDGNDVLAVLAAIRMGARPRPARAAGPTFIEAVTYRMGPHTTSDDPTRYRDQDELERWAATDPIAGSKRCCARKGDVRRRTSGGCRRRRATPSPRHCGQRPRHADPRAAGRLRPRVQRAAQRPGPPADALSPLPGRRSTTVKTVTR